MNPLVEDSGIASQPMALAKKFTTPDKTVILSANRDDGAEPQFQMVRSAFLEAMQFLSPI